jgi:CheY-like chemotaxis protein
VLVRSPDSQPPTTVGPRTAPAALLALTDDLELRDLLLELAMAEGYGVKCVTTEAEAAAALHAERPGLVVADLDMPTRAGALFLRALRRSPHRDIPCFAVTATNDMMIAVSIDAPVFFKPAVEGMAEALARLFGVSRPNAD